MSTDKNMRATARLGEPAIDRANERLDLLVTGTGPLGCAVARAASAAGHRVVVLTGNARTRKARSLGRLGCEVVEGGLDDVEKLTSLMSGVGAVFAVATSLEAGTLVEVRHGHVLVDAAQRARIAHFVYCSSASADQGTSVDRLDSKLAVEHHLRESTVPHTIVAPVFFMENLVSDWLLGGQNDCLTMPLPARRRLQLISVHDVASFVAFVLRSGEHFLGRRIELAADEKTGQEIASALGRVAGRPIGYGHQPFATFREHNPARAQLFSWLDDVGYAVDIDSLKSEYAQIGWHSLDRWAVDHAWAPAGAKTSPGQPTAANS